MKLSQPPQRTPVVAATTILTPTNPEELQWARQELQLGIARRAYELFEARGCEHGHDWEDWFRAESELLRPVSFVTSDKPTGVSVRANVLGFDASELMAAVEPHRLVILGRKRIDEPDAAKTGPADWVPDQILQVIELPAEIEPEGAVIELKTGVLSFELPKPALCRGRAA
jgi:HSP20 family molecular chaperone IbpA